ncbi:MAG TPA: cytochrome c [Steroidobacter sp.]|nr:cytochrome c [Steroidobacter sp.]
MISSMQRGLGLAAVASVALSAIPAFAPAMASSIDPSIVERGRYLALAGNCASCHTAKGGESLAGGLAFQTPFGTVYSTNITPDKATGIGDWTREQFVQSLRQGVRPNGDHLYPVFPYTAFARISDADADALYAYFMSVPAVSAPALENDMKFPFSQRALLSVWKSMYLDKGAYQPDSTRSEEWNRGAYLVEGLGHCSACHSPRNFLGAEKSSAKLTGGEYLDAVATGELRTWSTPNLTSAKSGLGSWSVEALAAYLKTGRNEHTETFGPMNEVIMNSTRHLSDADVRAMATYLNSLPPQENATKSAANEQTLQAGSTLYDVHCGTCHLPTGLGSQNEDSGARLAGSPVVQASNPAALINVILYAPQPPEPPLPKRWNRMAAFGDKLSDEEIAALASFLRSAWGNSGGEVTADQVAKQR